MDDSPADYFTRVQASNWGQTLNAFARFVAPQAGWRTLDVGCGPGALVRQFAETGCEVAGVDRDPAMIARARELAPALEFHEGDVLRLPFAPDTFDVVTATNVIFLQSDPQAALGEMARVCRAGGLVAVLNPSPALSKASAQAHAEAVGLTGFDAFSFMNWGNVAERHHRLSENDLHTLCAGCGLVVVEIQPRIGPGLTLWLKATKNPTA